MFLFALSLVAALVAIPPLTPDQRAQLDGARDGIDERGRAFAAMLENVRLWTPDAAGGVGNLPDIAAMMDRPAAFRGELFSIGGTLQQQSRPGEPGIGEWFVRDGAGRPILLYVHGLPDDHGFRDGQRVVVPARFYKLVETRARDGNVRVYPAFVGALPRHAPADPRWARTWVVVVPVLVMMAVFLALLVYARRGGHPPPRRTFAAPDLDVEQPPLPADPADALAELRRRARPEGS